MGHEAGHGPKAGLQMASKFVSAGAVMDPKEEAEKAERARMLPIRQGGY